MEKLNQKQPTEIIFNSQYLLQKLLGTMQNEDQKKILKETLDSENKIFNKWVKEIDSSKWTTIADTIKGGIEDIPKIEPWLYSNGPAKNISNGIIELVYCGVVIAKAGKSAYDSDESHLCAVHNFLDEAINIGDAMEATPKPVQESVQYLQSIINNLETQYNQCQL